MWACKAARLGTQENKSKASQKSKGLIWLTYPFVSLAFSLSIAADCFVLLMQSSADIWILILESFHYYSLLMMSTNSKSCYLKSCFQCCTFDEAENTIPHVRLCGQQSKVWSPEECQESLTHKWWILGLKVEPSNMPNCMRSCICAVHIRFLRSPASSALLRLHDEDAEPNVTRDFCKYKKGNTVQICNIVWAALESEDVWFFMDISQLFLAPAMHAGPRQMDVWPCFYFLNTSF